jgi:hypothetical protein
VRRPIEQFSGVLVQTRQIADSDLALPATPTVIGKP